MVRQRPTTILVVAILHIVGGSIGMFGSCYTVVTLGVAQASPAAPPTPTTQRGPTAPPTTSELLKYCETHAPGYWAYQIGALVASFVLDIMLLAAGIGLLKMLPWARTLSIVYAPLSILFHIVSFVYQMIFLVPAMSEAYNQYPAFASLSSIMTIALYLGLGASLLVTIYPIVVLVIMLKRLTAAAFRGERVSQGEDESSEEDPWREPPRSDAFTR